MIVIKKEEEITTNFKPTDDLDVINKSHLDEKMKKIGGHSLYTEIDKNTTNNL